MYSVEGHGAFRSVHTSLIGPQLTCVCINQPQPLFMPQKLRPPIETPFCQHSQWALKERGQPREIRRSCHHTYQMVRVTRTYTFKFLCMMHLP